MIEGNPARCPDCGAMLRFSFGDDVNERMVYQCSTVGVETVRTIGRDTALARTLDHSDRYFMRLHGQTLRVRPVRLSRQHSEMLLKRKGYPFEKDEVTRKNIVPTCWTTARV